LTGFEPQVPGGDDRTFRGIDLRTLVVNVTLRCNQACVHCHVRSAPWRDETMGPDVMAKVAELAGTLDPDLVDITGGAPELNPDLPSFIRTLKGDGRRVQLRTNLTVLEQPGFSDLPALFADLDVELLASMPCYTERNVRIVRGKGVHDASIGALRRLNDLGYGTEGGKRLDLVYNPVGTTLPEPQLLLEDLFRQELSDRFGIVFSHLLTMTNMPCGRFGERLIADGGYDRYVRALREAFNPDVVPLVQCRHQIEVGWDGLLYDCDFNLGDGLRVSPDAPTSIWEFEADSVAHRRIVLHEHCYGCTAGAGSS